MRSLEVVGPFRGPSGYDRYTREIVRELVRAGVRVQLSGLPGWVPDLAPEQREGWFDELIEPVGAHAVLHCAMPDRAWPRSGKRNLNFTMFEADRIPAAWAEHARGYDRIVVPTTSSLRAWQAGGVPGERLRLCPLGVGAFFAEPAAPLALDDGNGRSVLTYRYRFLNVAEPRPRKNQLGLLRTWIAATSKRDDAILILKLTTFGPRALEQFHADVRAMQARLGRTLAEAAPVVCIGGVLPDWQLRALLRAATHYISLSKGEGWDQVMMEAAVAGLSLIAPAHSAYRDYLRADEAELIPAALAPAVCEGQCGREDQALFDGASWWQPSEPDAAAAIRRIVDGRAAPRRSPRERFLSEYSWARAARRLIALLDELG